MNATARRESASAEIDPPRAETIQDWITSTLECLARMEEAGLYAGMASMLAYEQRTIEQWGNENARSQLQFYRERLAAAQVYERTHGSRALVKRDHPLNVKLERIREARRQERAATRSGELLRR